MLNRSLCPAIVVLLALAPAASGQQRPGAPPDAPQRAQAPGQYETAGAGARRGTGAAAENAAVARAGVTAMSLFFNTGRFQLLEPAQVITARFEIGDYFEITASVTACYFGGFRNHHSSDYHWHSGNGRAE